MTTNSTTTDTSPNNQTDMFGNLAVGQNNGYNPNFPQGFTPNNLPTNPFMPSPKPNKLGELSQMLGNPTPNPTNFGQANNNPIFPNQNFPQNNQVNQTVFTAPVANPINPFAYNPSTNNDFPNYNTGNDGNNFQNQGQFYSTIPAQIAPSQDIVNPFGQPFNQSQGFTDYSTQFYQDGNYQDNINSNFNYNPNLNGGGFPVPALNPIYSQAPTQQYNPQKFVPQPNNLPSLRPEDFAGQASQPQGRIETSNIQNNLATQPAETKPVQNPAQVQTANNIIPKPAPMTSGKHDKVENLKLDKISRVEESKILEGIKLLKAKGAGAVVSAQGLFGEARLAHKRNTDS